MSTDQQNRSVAAKIPEPPELKIDPDDPLGPVRDLAREAMGHFPSPPTMWRWCGRGATGIRLPAVMLSGRWMTTRRCWLAWLEARTAAKLDRDTVQDVSDSDLNEVGLE